MSHPSTPNPSSNREPFIACPPFPPWSFPTFSVTPSIPGCSRKDPLPTRKAVAEDYLDSLPPSDLCVWTDGSVPHNFGPGGAGVLACCSICDSSFSFSYSDGPVSSSFTAEVSALGHALSWCIEHQNTCSFSSLTLFSDSQSLLSTLASSPKFLEPHSIWTIWSSISALSALVKLSFQWVPGHTDLCGNDIADSLAKAGSLLPTDSSFIALGPHSACTSVSLYSSWRRSVKFDKSLLPCQVPNVSSEELALPRNVRCALSRLRCNGHSLLLASYLARIGRSTSSSCSACGDSTQDLRHILLDCSSLEPIRRAIFGSSLSPLDLWSRPWGVARMLGLRGVAPRPHPPDGVG